MDSDQDGWSVGLALGPNCMQRLSADAIKVTACIQRVNKILLEFHKNNFIPEWLCPCCKIHSGVICPRCKKIRGGRGYVHLAKNMRGLCPPIQK